jgi:hypothetical protein
MKDFWLIGKCPDEKKWHFYGSFSTQENAETEMEIRHSCDPSQEFRIAVPKQVA